jgi:hypothetical protein
VTTARATAADVRRVLPLVTARANVRRQTGAAGVVTAFVETIALYTMMLLAPAALSAALFAFGSPEWGPLMTGFFGLLLIGAAYVAAALVVSSLSTRTLAALLITGSSATPTSSRTTPRTSQAMPRCSCRWFIGCDVKRS